MSHADHLKVVAYAAVPDESNPYPLRTIYVVRDNDAVCAFEDKDDAEEYAVNRRKEERK